MGDEGRSVGRGQAPCAENDGGGPAPGGGFDDAVYEAGEGDDGQAEAGQIERSAGGVSGGGHEPLDEDQGGQAEGDVDGEDGAPGEVGEQEASGQGADGDAEPGDPGPGGDGLGPFAGFDEDVGEDGQGGGHDESAAYAHQAAGGDELVGGMRQGGGHAAGDEYAQAGGQSAFAAVAVAQGSGGEEQPGEDQGVGVDDPLQLAGGGVHVAGEAGQGHVEDGGVDGDDQQ